MVDPIDEYVLQRVREFNGKKLVNVSKSSKDFVQEENTEEHSAVCKAFQDTLNEHVEKVVVSVRLSDDVPCVLVSTEYGWSANMERILKAQALAQKGASSFQAQKKILEINPNNRLVKTIHDAVLNNNLSERVVKDTIRLMYDTAMIASGYTQEDPVLFTKRVFNMMHAGLVGSSSGAEEEEETVGVETDSENNNMESLD
jgi:molecular chaperone HtpG